LAYRTCPDCGAVCEADDYALHALTAVDAETKIAAMDRLLRYEQRGRR
jgi:hypothetical protein